MASAASRMILSVTWFSQTYQLFQPMCGVSARVSPQTIRNGRLAVPWVLDTSKTTSWVPGCSSRPVIWPVAASTTSPAGSPFAP